METSALPKEPENETSPKGRAYWEQIQAEWKRSGLSQPVFCRERRIVYSTFIYWRTKLKEKKNPNHKSESFPFAEIKINPVKPMGLPSSEIKLRLPNGLMVFIDKYADMGQLREVLVLLEVVL